MSSAEQEEGEEKEEAVVEALPIELWVSLVLPRLRPSEARVVGLGGGIAWLAVLAAQRLRSVKVLCALFYYCFFYKTTLIWSDAVEVVCKPLLLPSFQPARGC